jgi:hypothetical protein
LSQGLALNDDLQRVLAKHDAIAAGVAVRVEKPEALPARAESSSTKAEVTKETDQRLRSLKLFFFDNDGLVALTTVSELDFFL